MQNNVLLSEAKRQERDGGYFGEKKVQTIKDSLIGKGIKVGRKGCNTLEAELEGVIVKVSLGNFPSRVAEEEILKGSGYVGDRRSKMYDHTLTNESITLEFAGAVRYFRGSRETLPLKFESTNVFEHTLQIYAKIYEHLINTIYESEELLPPNVDIDLHNSIVFPISKRFDPTIGGYVFAPNAPVNKSPVAVFRNKDVHDKDLDTTNFFKFDGIAGQDEAIAEAKKLVQAIKNPEVYQKRGVKIPKGILFYGPPGTGKTMLAKAVAQESGAKLIEVSVADIGSKWHGESEKMLQSIFDSAKTGGKTIIFFDEFDSFAPPRDDSYEVTRKIIAVFNQNMDGVRSSDNITVIAATNRPEGVDLAAKRSGRFDKMIEVPLPNPVGRIAILKKHMEKAMKESAEPDTLFAKNINLDEVANLTNGLSGADLANLVNQVLEQKMTDEMNGKTWTPVNTDEIIETANKLILSRTESIAVDFSKKK